MNNAKQFVNLLEQTYGPYQGPAMKVVIAKRLSRASVTHLSRLYEAITSAYMYSQPPTLAHILKYQRDLPPTQRGMIEDKTEECVSPEEGLRFIKELMQKLGEKNV